MAIWVQILDDAVCISQIPSGKVWIQLFWYGNQSKRRKTDSKPVKLRLKIDLALHPVCAEGWVSKSIFFQVLVQLADSTFTNLNFSFSGYRDTKTTTDFLHCSIAPKLSL